jgi:hypothetical protein
MPPLVLQSSLAALSIADHQAAAVKPDPPLPWKIPGGQFASIGKYNLKPCDMYNNLKPCDMYNNSNFAH